MKLWRVAFQRVSGKKGGKGRKSTGDTLYCGSRTSPTFGRLYDKGLQTGAAVAGRWFRYEVEYKGHVAQQVAKEAHVQPVDGLAEWATTQVRAWFMKRGIVPVFEKMGDTPEFHIRSLIRVI